VALDALGLPEASLTALRLMLARPEGLLLLTGPTGSGKTTTLYSILSEINSVAINIMTLEDPVEYPLAMVRQTGLSDAVKMDFADGIRAMLRQDPDVILVGEIRDRETADMALRAALTGHQVFSTLHCNSAVGAIPRLLDLGIAPDLIASSLIGVVAQRLVRRLCHCATRMPASEVEQRLLNINEPILLPRPVGCPDCAHQGYRGRIAIMEVLRMDARLEALVARRATRGELTEAAQSAGMTSLADEACRRVLAGETCLDEVRRVVDLTARMTP
jgi:type II secretory ATPase GspE/PulE/Tfp pilus assembly ATPase PilB-like protein